MRAAHRRKDTTLAWKHIAVMLLHFNVAAFRIFKDATKLVDFGDDAVYKWLQLFGSKPQGSVTDGRDEGATC